MAVSSKSDIKKILAAAFLALFFLFPGIEISATPLVRPKERIYYEVHAVRNGALELIFTGPKLVHNAIHDVMKELGIEKYRLKPVRTQGETYISVYSYRREGKVPFFMFHRMNSNARDPYGITPDNFKRFLNALKANNFYPLGHTAVYDADFSGVPPGFHPCSIIVDDLDQGWGDFADMIEDYFGRDLNGRIPVTFSVPFVYYGRPVFSGSGNAAETLRWILDHAYLANHSLEHKPLTSYGSDIDGFIREQIDGWYDKAEICIGKDAYAVDTFVLPEGIGLTNDYFMQRMKEHPYVRHVVGVVDSIADPWKGPVYRYIVNNSLWKQAVERAALENSYTTGRPGNIIEHAVFIIQNPEKIDVGGLPTGLDPEKLPVYVIVKKDFINM